METIMYIKGDKVGNFKIISEASKDEKYRVTYLVECMGCGSRITIRSDKLKKLQHCNNSHASCADPLKSLKYSHSYILKYNQCDEEWYDFHDFYSDVISTIGPRPSSSHVLTRLNKEKPYGKHNIEWSLYYHTNGNTK